MRIPAPEVTQILRSTRSERTFDVRDQSGALAGVVTTHEAELLCEHGHVEGVVSKSGFLKKLRLLVSERVAFAKLRRKMAATGRTISEACQTISKVEVAGRRVLYQHDMRRSGTYAPKLRGEFMQTITA
jgi:hypothetical protein